MTVLLYAIYFTASLVLLAWTILLWRKTRAMGLAFVAAVLVGIGYDTLLIGTGALIGPGTLLMALNWPRFLLHALLTPLLLVAALDLASRAGLEWARQSSTWLAVWSVVGGLIVLDIATDLVGLELVPRYFQGTLRYAEAVTIPPIATIAVVCLLVIGSAFFWYGTGWPWLFAASMLTLASGGVPVTLVGPAVTSGAELVLLGCLLVAERRFAARPAEAEAVMPQNAEAEVLLSRSVGE